MTLGGIDRHESIELQQQEEKKLRKEERRKTEEQRKAKERERVSGAQSEQALANAVFFAEKEDVPERGRKRKESDDEFDPELVEVPRKKRNMTGPIHVAVG